MISVCVRCKLPWYLCNFSMVVAAKWQGDLFREGRDVDGCGILCVQGVSNISWAPTGGNLPPYAVLTEQKFLHPRAQNGVPDGPTRVYCWLWVYARYEREMKELRTCIPSSNRHLMGWSQSSKLIISALAEILFGYTKVINNFLFMRRFYKILNSNKDP